MRVLNKIPLVSLNNPDLVSLERGDNFLKGIRLNEDTLEKITNYVPGELMKLSDGPESSETQQKSIWLKPRGTRQSLFMRG